MAEFLDLLFVHIAILQTQYTDLMKGVFSYSTCAKLKKIFYSITPCYAQVLIYAEM